jgi:isochorismate hydrolase
MSNGVATLLQHSARSGFAAAAKHLILSIILIVATASVAEAAFVVIDMQNYYLKSGYLGDVPLARDIVPAINKFAADLRGRGAHVIWVKNASNDTRENWSVYHEWLMSPEFCERRFATLDVEHEGHQLWAELDVKLEDTQIVKRRFCLHTRLVRYCSLSSQPWN